MFIVISLIVASNSKWSKYPLIIGKWINNSNNWRVPKTKRKEKKSTKWKKPDTKGTKDYVSYDSIYMKCCNRQNWRSVVVRDWEGCEGTGGGECGEEVCPKSGCRKIFGITCSVSWL